MKKFLIIIFGLVILFILIDKAIGFGIEKLISNQKSDIIFHLKTKVNRKADIAILGSSRAEGHYNNNLLSDSLCKYVINYGVPGTGTITQLFIFKNIINSNKNLKLAILDIKPYEFSDAFDISELNKIYPLYVNDENLYSLVSEYSTAEFIKIHCKMYRYNNKVITLLKGVFKDKSYDTSFLNFKGFKNVAILPNYKEYEYLNTEDTYLKCINDIIKEAKNANIKLVFSISPMYAKIKKSRTIELVDSICLKNNIPLLNNVAVYKLPEENVLFKDYTHLNKAGAEKFTKEILTPQLKQILQ